MIWGLDEGGKIVNFTVTVDPAPAGRWRASVRELPEAAAFGDSPEEALRATRELAAQILARRLETDQSAPTRRQFIMAALAAAFVTAFAAGCAKRDPIPEMATGNGHSSGDVDLTLHINGAPHALKVEPRVTLLDALRERLALTGTKKGCDHGQCGACTVLVDGRRINSCLTFAVMCDGKRITTVEGLAKDGELHPVQAAFIARDAFQCGYCTPGQICSAVGLLSEGHHKTDEEIREWMSGNLCRCGAYPNIVAAVRDAAARK